MKTTTVVLMVLFLLLLACFYVWHFQTLRFAQLYLPVTVPFALASIVGIITCLGKRNYNPLAFFIVLLFASPLLGILFRGVFLPTIIIE